MWHLFYSLRLDVPPSFAFYDTTCLWFSSGLRVALLILLILFYSKLNHWSESSSCSLLNPYSTFYILHSDISSELQTYKPTPTWHLQLDGTRLLQLSMTKTDLWVCPTWADLFFCSLTQWCPPHPSNCISPKPRRSLSLSLHIQLVSKFHWFLPSYCLTDTPTSLQLYHHLSSSSMVHHNYLLTHLLQQLHLPFTSLFSTLQLLLMYFLNANLIYPTAFTGFPLPWEYTEKLTKMLSWLLLISVASSVSDPTPSPSFSAPHEFLVPPFCCVFAQSSPLFLLNLQTQLK